MSKAIKTILIVTTLIVLLGTIFGIIDHERAMEGKKPIFAINMGKNEVTGAELYYGLGYVAVRCVQAEPFNAEYINIEPFYSKKVKHVCFSGKSY